MGIERTPAYRLAQGNTLYRDTIYRELPYTDLSKQRHQNQTSRRGQLLAFGALQGKYPEAINENRSWGTFELTVEGRKAEACVAQHSPLQDYFVALLSQWRARRQVEQYSTNEWTLRELERRGQEVSAAEANLVSALKGITMQKVRQDLCAKLVERDARAQLWAQQYAALEAMDLLFIAV